MTQNQLIRDTYYCLAAIFYLYILILFNGFGYAVVFYYVGSPGYFIFNGMERDLSFACLRNDLHALIFLLMRFPFHVGGRKA